MKNVQMMRKKVHVCRVTSRQELSRNLCSAERTFM
nr:F54F2.3 protein - Caenorhabditis elegans [Caenorhabditis elegans]